MQSIFENGGFLGRTFDLADPDRYLISQTTFTPTYVGGKVMVNLAASNSLSSLTGGIASSPRAGDTVIIILQVAGQVMTNASSPVAGYTPIVDLFVDSDDDTNFFILYKKMGSTPDSNFTFTAPANTDSTAAVIYAFSGIDMTRAAALTATNTEADSTAPAITPTVTGSIVLTGGAVSVESNDAISFSTISGLNNFLSDDHLVGGGASSALVGAGWTTWTSGSLGPYLWNGPNPGGSTSAAATVAIPPQIDTVYGNKKNSGIWNTMAVQDSIGAGLKTPIFVGQKNISQAATANDLSITLDGLSGGIASTPSPGDLVIASICFVNSSDRAYNISGYTQIVDLYSNGGSQDVHLFVGYKEYASSDTSVTFTGGNFNSQGSIVTVMAWRNVDTTNPLAEPAASNVVTTNATSIIPPAETTIFARSLVLSFAVAGYSTISGGQNFTLPSIYDRTIVTNNASGTSDSTFAIGAKVINAGGTTFTSTAWTMPTTSPSSLATSFQLKPKDIRYA